MNAAWKVDGRDDLWGLTVRPSGTFGTVVRTALTAAFSARPPAHDGESAFTFTLTFSEDVGGLSFRPLKFGGIQVSGGTVMAGRAYRARTGMVRLEPGQTAKTASVPVIADDHDEGSETMTLLMQGGYLELAAGKRPRL